MDALDAILEDWRLCGRGKNGAVLRADRLRELIDRVGERVADDRVPDPAKRRTYELLRPSAATGGLPPLVKQLHIDGRYGASAGGGAAVVHFAFFWRALEEVWRRLHGGAEAAPEERDCEPLAVEASSFRDAVLARREAGSLTSTAFVEELAAARKASLDQRAWDPLEAVAKQTLELEEPSASAQPLRLDVVSMLLLVWLQEVVEDYRQGDRAEKIRNVRDVLRCKVHDACVHLGASGWDIEAALRRAFVGSQAPLAALAAGSLGEAWSSNSAKLRSKELQCPICVQDFCPGTESLATRCCFQVICVHCIVSLTTAEGLLLCPFCRCAKASPSTAESSDDPRSEDFFTDVFRAAGTYCAKQADHLTKEFLAALQHAEAGPQYDLRLDVVMRAAPQSRGPGHAGG